MGMSVLEEAKMDAGSPHQRRGRGRLRPSIPGGLGVRLGDRDGETKENSQNNFEKEE